MVRGHLQCNPYKGTQMTTTNPPTAAPAARSAAAERMRAHRQRRREGLRCLTIEIRDGEIDALVRKQLLKPETRNDLGAIIDAL
jgi:hypothetical protein